MWFYVIPGELYSIYLYDYSYGYGPIIFLIFFIMLLFFGWRTIMSIFFG